MIEYKIGNIFESKAQALVNTVNTVGVMGKGIALQFKRAFPKNYLIYSKACKNGDVDIGKLLVTRDSKLEGGEKIIINFPTKKHWRKPSEYIYIEEGLDDLLRIIDEFQIKSIAIPPLGAGNGGLKWQKVKSILERKLKGLDIDVIIYEPTSHIKEKLKKERVKLTDARALLLYVLYDLVKNGEYVSEFSSEKVCYFLQRFGAKRYFKLKYTPNFYGPYSGKVRYILNVLNGSYLLGYSDMNKKPFEPLTLIADGYKDVDDYIQSKQELLEIAEKTINFLNGFYSDFALELLSSIDCVSEEKKNLDIDVINERLNNWNERKRTLFSNPKYIRVSINHLNQTEFA